MTTRHTPTRRTILATLAGGAVLALASGFTSARPARGTTPERQLAGVRSATARYHDQEHALAADYTPVSPFTCGQGIHLEDRALQNAIIAGDTPLDRETPPLLTYGETEDGTPFLGSVAYMTPAGEEGARIDPPDLFDSDDERWLLLPGDHPGTPPLDLWILHVWVHAHNPDGVFAPTNPRPQFQRDRTGMGPDACVPAPELET